MAIWDVPDYYGEEPAGDKISTLRYAIFPQFISSKISSLIKGDLADVAGHSLSVF